MPSRIPTKMKADQLMQGKKQSCKPQSEACPQCPRPRAGPGSEAALGATQRGDRDLLCPGEITALKPG